MKRETFVLVFAFVGMILAGLILLGNRGIVPDFSFYLWPGLVVCLSTIVLTHPISKLCRAVKFFLNKFNTTNEKRT